MEEAKRFGARLKELRIQAGLTQRELAGKVNVDFTYLSKIENGVLPPPSEKVILQLAEVLNADKDELMTLAGKIPADIAEILKNREALQLLRSDRARQKARTAKEKKVMSMPNLSIPIKRLSRIAVPIMLVIAVASSLWFAAPTQALEISFPSLPSGTLGSTHSASVKITIIGVEHLPAHSVNIEIYNVNDETKKATLNNLPLVSATKSYTSAETGNGGAVTVTATPAYGWAYGTGTGYVDWKGSAYNFGSTGGYTYAYGSGTTSITYDISWTSPSGWPAGNYIISAEINANSDTFTDTSTAFSLSAAEEEAGPSPAAPAETAAEELEEMTDEEAAEVVEELTDKAAAEVLAEVDTEKAADIIEEVDTEKAADILEVMNTDKAADIIEEVDTEKAADIIEEVATEKAADIIEEVTTEKAADIIEEVATEKAADILEEVEADKAAAIMEELPTEKLNETIPEMSEESLTERLPGLSPEKLHSVEPEVLFASLPNAPTEQLTSEEPPEPPADLTDPVVVFTTPSGARYLAIRTVAGEWVVVVGTPEPIEKLLIKTRQALTDVGTTIEVYEERPPEVLKDLPDYKIVRAYIKVTFENAAPEDIELGHMTFKVEKEWLEQNSIHKWSVTLEHLSMDDGKWTSLPTKRVKEDDTDVYYTVTITRFSIFAITGTETIPALEFEATNLSISPTDAQAGEDITITADISNLSDEGTYVVTLWINGTVEAGKEVTLDTNETKSVSFTVTKKAEGDYEVRIDRLFGSFSLTEAPAPAPAPAPPAPPPAPPKPPVTPAPAPAPTPAPPPAPPAPPPTPPVTPINWWLIGGIIAVVIIIAAVAWILVARRRD